MSETITYCVPGMSCGHCRAAITAEVSRCRRRRVRRRRPRHEARPDHRREPRRRGARRRDRRGRLRGGAAHDRTTPRSSPPSPPSWPSSSAPPHSPAAPSAAPRAAAAATDGDGDGRRPRPRPRGRATAGSRSSSPAAPRAARQSLPARVPHRRQARARPCKRLRRRAHQADAPHRRAPRHDRLPAPPPDPGARRHLAVPLTLHEAGSYRVFADFSVDGTPHTLADDLAVDGDRHAGARCPRRRRPRRPTASRVRLDRGPRPRRQGVEAALHRHAERATGRGCRTTSVRRATWSRCAKATSPSCTSTRTTDSAATSRRRFPSAGRYRLFLQFKVDGAFTPPRSPRRSSR